MLRNLALALAAVSAVCIPAAAADDPPAKLKFAWPVPSKATVTEKIWKGGLTATTRYTVTVERSGSGDDLRVHLGDLEFLEMAGRPPTDPAIAKQIADAQALARMTPDLLVSPDGAVKDVLGLDALIEAQIVEIEKNADEKQKALLPALRARLTSPEEREAKKRESARWWRTWVTEWVGIAVAEGHDVEAKRPVRDVTGEERDAPAIYRLAPAPEGGGLVLVSREAALDGAQTKASLDAMIRALSRQSGKAPPEGHFTGLRLTSRAAATLDPATLRPKRALSDESQVVHVKDAADQIVGPRGLERHEYEFGWNESKPAASDK